MVTGDSRKTRDAERKISKNDGGMKAGIYEEVLAEEKMCRKEEVKNVTFFIQKDTNKRGSIKKMLNRECNMIY